MLWKKEKLFFLKIVFLFFFSKFHESIQGKIFLVLHRNLQCIFHTTATKTFCVAVFFHSSVHDTIWNIIHWAESANQTRVGKLFTAITQSQFTITPIPTYESINQSCQPLRFYHNYYVFSTNYGITVFLHTLRFFPIST